MVSKSDGSAAATSSRPQTGQPAPAEDVRLACADFTFPLLDHDAVLDLIALLEIKGVDIGLFEERSHLWPSRVFQNIEQSARTLRTKLNDRGLVPADIFLQTAPDFVALAANHPNAARRRKARDMFVRTLDFAAACGSRHVSALPGVRFADEPARASLARCLDEMAWRCEQADRMKLIFSIEAHVGSIAPLPHHALRLVESVPGLTLTLDYTHFTRRGIADAEVEPLLPYARHIHVRGARRGRLQASFRDNVIDYERMFRRLEQLGYTGFIGLEYVWIDWEHCNEVDNVSETIQWRNFFRGLARKPPDKGKVRPAKAAADSRIPPRRKRSDGAERPSAGQGDASVD